MLEIKDPDEPSFFEGFVKTEKTELHSNLFSSITEEEIPFSFVYSNLNQNILQVYLKYQVRYNDLSFLYEKQELDFLYIDDMILLNIPVNLLNEQSCIFEIILKYNNQKTILRCWYIDQIKLDYYRNNITSMTFSAPAEGDDPEKFSEYYSAVFDALFNDETNEIIEEINEEMSVKLTTQSEDISEEESTEDITEFILDKDISDKFVEKNTMFHAAYESAKKLAPLYYNSLLQTGKHYSKNNIEHVDNSKEQKQQRTATSSEKRLSKTIKRNLKKHFLFINTTLLSYDYYLHLCGIVLYVIHQMRYKEKIVDFMSSEEVIQIKCKFSEILLEKYSNEQTDNDFMLLSRFVLMTIIELGIQKQRDKDGIARKLLLSLNKIRNIRESYTNILNELDTREVITENIPFGADTYIRKLYGYRTFEELVRFFEDTYHSKCIFNNNKSILDILIDSKAPEALADSIIREVVKYLHEYDHSKTMIRFSFFPADGKNAVFIVKLADYRINTVKKQVMQKKGKAEYRCILRDMRWIPIYF